jgi:hypothetical protein
MDADTTIRRRDLGRLERIGSGGTAVIYGVPDWNTDAFGIPNAEGTVFKEYKERIRNRAGPSLLPGLQALVQFRTQNLVEAQRTEWDKRIIWPVQVVVDSNGAARGVLMAVVPRRFFHRFRSRSRGTYLAPRHADTLFGDDHTMYRIGLTPVPLNTRLALVAAIARCYGMMHYAGIVIGDISGRNLVYSPDGARPQVLAIDTDSARVKSTRAVFERQPHTPRWEPPEALHARREYTRDPRRDPPTGLTKQNIQTDIYKFGLLVVRILDYGRGRAPNRDPRQAAVVLRNTIGPPASTLLLSTLADNPADRPTMRDWYDMTRAHLVDSDDPTLLRRSRP